MFFAKYSPNKSFRISKSVSKNAPESAKIRAFFAKQLFCFQCSASAFCALHSILSIHLNSLGLLIAGKIRIAWKTCQRDHEVHDRDIDRNRTTRTCETNKHHLHDDDFNSRSRRRLEAARRSRPARAVFLRRHDNRRLLPSGMRQPQAAAPERPLLSFCGRCTDRRLSSLPSLPTHLDCIEQALGSDSRPY